MTIVSTLPDRADTAARRSASPSVLDTLRLWRRRARERAELARFSTRELRDIGITPADALHEISKPAWRA
ncbi:MAG TPA: DUF1127 domain-containing protein [Vineibacter sp.]|nr:DUF1127 domain-containing protein [Vineibacter sp.]